MTRSSGLAVLLGLIVSAMLKNSSAAELAPKQWSVNNADQLSYGVSYELYNTTAQIGYDERKFGINLGWVGHSGGYFEFLRQAPLGVQDHRNGPIGGDENVAIYNTLARRYLAYDKRGDTEAELEWSSKPKYEWQVHDQSTANGRVHFALFNNRVNKYLVHALKNYGINLGWYDDKPAGALSSSVSLLAQTVIEGPVPYLGSFPVIGYLNGVLLTVQNASDSATLFFVKPGKSTINCWEKNATVVVAPRTIMTAEELKTLYGSATPRFPVNFLACVAAPPSQPISTTYLNITYRADR